MLGRLRDVLLGKGSFTRIWLGVVGVFGLMAVSAFAVDWFLRLRPTLDVLAGGLITAATLGVVFGGRYVLDVSI